MSNDNRTTPPGAFDTVLAEIAAERERQIAKWYTAEHDDGHPHGTLPDAAIAYIKRWPAQGDRRRDLIKAAALLVAEIQRIDRARLVANG
jgi:hypothetical protein